LTAARADVANSILLEPVFSKAPDYGALVRFL